MVGLNLLPADLAACALPSKTNGHKNKLLLLTKESIDAHRKILNQQKIPGIFSEHRTEFDACSFLLGLPTLSFRTLFFSMVFCFQMLADNLVKNGRHKKCSSQRFSEMLWPVLRVCIWKNTFAHRRMMLEFTVAIPCVWWDGGVTCNSQ